MKTRKRTALLTVPGRLGIVLILLVAALGTLPVPAAHAATYTVCAIGCDFTTIQAAIDAVGTVNGDTINVTDATHTEAGITVTKDLTIQGQGASNTIVQANAARDVASDRVFNIASSSTVTITDMTIQHGNVTGRGGGIYNDGTLTLENVTVKENDASDDGGGIYNDWLGNVILTNSTVSGNTADDDGGGIYQQGGCFAADTRVLLADGGYKRIADVQVGDVVQGYDFVANERVVNVVQRTFQFEADSYLQINGLQVTESHPFAIGPDQWVPAGQLQVGDGVVGDGFTEITHVAQVYESIGVYNLTVSGAHNFYVSDGSDLFLVHNKAMLATATPGAYLNNVTITDNTADDDNIGGGDGGGVYFGGGVPEFEFRNTIIAGNDDPTSAPDCSGSSLTSQDYNLVGDKSGCNFTEQPHDQVGSGVSPIDPKLGPLADNGGPSETHALLTGSPAIDAIPEGGTGYNGAPPTDQRGVSRPQMAACDIGAYEAQLAIGGATEPVRPLALLWPWIALAAVVATAAIAAVTLKRRAA